MKRTVSHYEYKQRQSATKIEWTTEKQQAAAQTRCINYNQKEKT
jgi:hypothetical protein